MMIFSFFFWIWINSLISFSSFLALSIYCWEFHLDLRSWNSFLGESECHIKFTLNWIMINNNCLNNRIISFSFSKGQLKFIVFHALVNSWSLIINSISFNLNFNVFFMSSIFCSWFCNHIKVLQNYFATNFNVKNSLSLLLEVHLNKTKFTSANLMIIVLIPFLMGKSYVISWYVCLSYM